MQAAHDLLLPGCIHVLINGCVQTGNQIAGQFRAFVLRQRQRLLQQFMGFLRHKNYTLRCNLAYSPTTIFPFSSFTTYAHGNFASWVNMVSHFSGRAWA